MKLRSIFGCTPEQPLWLNRLRFTYLVPVSLLVAVMVFFVVVAFSICELLSHPGELKVALLNCRMYFRSFFGSFPELVWPATKVAWSTGR